MDRLARTLALALLTALAWTAPAAAGAPPLDADAVRDMVEATSGRAQVAVHPATGTVRFVRLSDGRPGTLAPAGVRAATPRASVEAFLAARAGLFGLRSADELSFLAERRDRLGATRVAYQQVAKGVPVFGAIVLGHLDAQGQLRAVNGTTVPDVPADLTPRLDAAAAARLAVGSAARDGKAAPSARHTRLVIYRLGLDRGVPGTTHLAWQVEVAGGGARREWVFVDAQAGRVIDRLPGAPTALSRKVYQQFYGSTPVWQEGDGLPFSGASAAAVNDEITGAGEAHRLFLNLSGGFYDSYDGRGHVMETVNEDAFTGCPNANWNGIWAGFCPGTSADDTVVHEWTHAYTEYTQGLVYRWQPGALNESYSDIFGETVDLLNARGSDAPDAPRSAGSCAATDRALVTLEVNAPASVSGPYPAAGAEFGPGLDRTGVTADLVLVDDGVGNTGDACEAFVQPSLGGRVALVERSTCAYPVQVKNAQVAGAVGVVVANHQAGGNTIEFLTGTDATVTIPSLFVGYFSGQRLRGELAGGVNVSLRQGSATTDDSLRWLWGEDDPGFGGAVRDMWNPACHHNAPRVSAPGYICESGDFGGVHFNSGVPNHAYALLVDGGSYNGQAIAGIGLTRAAHLYWRAMSEYQVPYSDFPDHADALEQACQDLQGADLPDLLTGAASGQTITPAHCSALAQVLLAVEMRQDVWCPFTPLLAQAPPPLCASGSAQLFGGSTFETDPRPAWTVSHTLAGAAALDQDWTWVTGLPHDRPGWALFAANPDSSCFGDHSAVYEVTSPAFSVPAGGSGPFLAFEHSVGTEAGWDGGDVQVSVNGGGWTSLAPGAFAYNGYNTTLFSSGAGNSDPLAGLPAFSGSDQGSVTGQWGRSQADLAGVAVAGDSVRLRFRLGMDFCSGGVGWFVDDVKLYTCVADAGPPVLSVTGNEVHEGDAVARSVDFQVALSRPSTQAVSVGYATSNGTAVAGPVFSGVALTLGDQAPATPYPSSVVVPQVDGVVTRLRVRVNGFSHASPEDVDLLLVGPGGQAAVLMSDVGGSQPVSGLDLVFDDAGAALGTGTLTAGVFAPSDRNDGVDTYPAPAPTGAFATSLSGLAFTEASGAWRLFALDDRGGAAGSIASWSLELMTTEADYAPAAGVLTFAPGETTRTVSVLVRPERIREEDEEFYLDLFAPAGATLGVARAAARIVNDDTAPGVRIGFTSLASTAAEGGTAPVSLRVTTTDGAPVARQATIGYATAGGTAVPGDDYTAAGGVLTIPAGTASGTAFPFDVAIRTDAIDEDDETIKVVLALDTDLLLGQVEHVITILDDDPPPDLSVDDPSADEGGTLQFAVTLSAASGRTVTVAYATSDGTAGAGSDYAAASGVLTFPAGVGTTRLAVPVGTSADALDEDDETVFLNLSSPVNAGFADSQGRGTLRDTNALPALSIGHATVSEAAAEAVFTASLAPPSGRTVTVAYATADGTARQPGDYLQAAGALTFAAGATTASVRVPIVNDGTGEPVEGFTVVLSAPVNASLSSAVGQGTITDDDGASVTAGSASALVGEVVSALVTSPGTATARDWVGLFLATDPNTPAALLDWFYLNGQKSAPPAPLASATLDFVMPRAGSLQFRLLANDGFTPLAQSGSVAVTAPVAPPSVTPARTSAVVGERVVFTVANGPAHARDWLGLYAVGALDGALLDWSYLDGTQDPPATGLSGAAVSFVLPPPGQYEVRLFADDSFSRLAVSAAVTVAAPAAGVLEASVGGFDFGRVTVGGIGSIGSVTVRNAGSAPLTVGASVSGTGFSLVSSSSFTVAPGASAFVLVKFLPPSVLRFAGSLALSGGGGATVQLVGAGVAGPTVAAARVQAAAGQRVVGYVEGGPANRTDWVALAPVGAPLPSYVDWSYLDRSKVRPAVGTATAIIDLALPVSAQGDYELRLFANDTFTLLATSHPVQVGEATSLTPATLTAARGSTLRVTLAGGPGNATDWVGLFEAGTERLESGGWQYLNGSQAAPVAGLASAVLDFVMPARPGYYVFRFFPSDGFTSTAVSLNVLVP